MLVLGGETPLVILGDSLELGQGLLENRGALLELLLGVRLGDAHTDVGLGWFHLLLDNVL